MTYKYYAVLVKKVGNKDVISQFDRKNVCDTWEQARDYAMTKNKDSERMSRVKGMWAAYYERA